MVIENQALDGGSSRHLTMMDVCDIHVDDKTEPAEPIEGDRARVMPRLFAFNFAVCFAPYMEILSIQNGL